MIIECTECGTRYQIEDGNISPPGKMARCTRCQKVFFVDIKSDGHHEEIPLEDTKSFSDPSINETDVNIKKQSGKSELAADEDQSWDEVTISDPELDHSEQSFGDELDDDSDEFHDQEDDVNPFKAPESTTARWPVAYAPASTSGVET